MTRGTETSLGRIVSALALDSLIESDRTARISGLIGPARSLVVAAIARKTSGPMLVVVADERRLAPAVSDLESLLRALGVSRRVLSFPAFALDPYRGLSPHLEVTSARLDALVSLLDGEDVDHTAREPFGLITFDVPEGEHAVELTLGSSGIARLSNWISLLSWLALAVAIAAMLVVSIKSRRRRASNDS